MIGQFEEEEWSILHSDVGGAGKCRHLTHNARYRFVTGRLVGHTEVILCRLARLVTGSRHSATIPGSDGCREMPRSMGVCRYEPENAANMFIARGSGGIPAIVSGRRPRADFRPEMSSELLVTRPTSVTCYSPS
jgi:hypothetical protein